MSLAAIIDHLSEERRREVDPSASSDDFFETYVSELLTRDFGLDWDDIDAGIVDGQDDGQIDAIYVLVDDQVVRESDDFNPKKVRRDALVRVIIHQAKNKVAFEENTWAKCRSSIADLFDLGIDINSLSRSYNSAVLSQVGLFRHIYLNLQGKNPSLFFDIFYATKGDKKSANARVRSDSKAPLLHHEC